MRKAIWIIIAALIAGYLAAAFLTVDRSSDEQRIAKVISQGAAAAQNRDLSGLLTLVSKHYTDESGLNYDRMRILIAKAMREESEYYVVVSNETIKAAGDNATVNLRVELKRTDGDLFYERNLTLTLVKESATHMLIAPTTAWRVVASRNLGVGLMEL